MFVLTREDTSTRVSRYVRAVVLCSSLLRCAHSTVAPLTLTQFDEDELTNSRRTERHTEFEWARDDQLYMDDSGDH